MQKRKIVLSREELAPLIPEVRETLKATPLPSLITKVEQGPYGLGLRGNEVLMLLEQAGALFSSLLAIIEDELLELEIPRGGEDQRKIPSIPVLLATHMACWYAARTLDEATNYSVRTVNAFDIKEIHNLLGKGDLVKALFADCHQFILKEGTGHMETLQKSTCAWFHLMVRSVEKIALDPRLRRVRRIMEQYRFTVLDLDFTPFSAPMSAGEESSVHLPITTDEIIGNSTYLQKGQRLVEDLLAFDPGEGKNPKKFNQILFGLGRPGCGKTASANALGNHLLERAAHVGVDARFVVIRRTDWASSYQNASSKALIERFQGALADFNGVVLFYWPDIDTAFSSRGGGDLRSEEKGILGAAFGLFDGTILPFNGQWGLVCDANYMQMDEATVSRLSQDPCEVRGPEGDEDYVALLRDVLLGPEYRTSLRLSDQEWGAVGALARELDLSGRDMRNLSRRLISIMEEFPYPEGFFAGDYEARLAMVRAARTPLAAERITAELRELERFKAQAKIMEERERLHARVAELELELRAREQVLGEEPGEQR